MLELFSHGFRIAALLLLLIFGSIVFRYEKRSFRKNILLFFLLTTLCYLLAYWEPVQTNQFLFPLPFFFAAQFPFSFWLVSKAFFDDEFSWSRTFSILSIAVPVVHYLLYRLNSIIQVDFYEPVKILPYLISAVFIFLVVFESLRNKENDLVLSRLKKRNVFVLFSSFLALATVFYFLTGDPLKLPPTVELIQNMVVCTFILLFFSDQFEYKKLFIDSSISSENGAKKKESEIQQGLIQKLLAVFEQEALYTNEGLTITQLSKTLNEKEYLVRRAINGELGYTNFNSFLNHYRIKEACRLIKESQPKEYTFQEIAYKMGYQSVATFNRAFKKETGLTPSAFAKQK